VSEGPPSASAPELSIVIVVVAGREPLARCLEALRRQEGAGSREVIVAHDDQHPDVQALEPRFADASFLRVPGTRTFAELRAAGVARAAAPIVALTEDHCAADPRWAAALVAAHAEDPRRAAVGGVVEKALPDTALDWAVYLLDYARYAGPQADGPVHALTDCNVSYKRSALAPLAALWRDEFHEPTVHAALEQGGLVLWLASAMVVWQRRPFTLMGALRDRWQYGRLFGSLRAAGTPFSRRLVLAALAPAVPALQVLRVAQHAHRAPQLRAGLLRALPWVVLLAVAWGAGELAGHATGRPPAALAARSLR
jgi:hypothetical protein